MRKATLHVFYNVVLMVLAILTMLSLQALAAPRAVMQMGRERLLLDSDWRFHAGDLNAGDGVAIMRWDWKADDRGEAAATDLAAPSLRLDNAWNMTGPNVVAVLVENTAGAGGIGEASIQAVSDAAQNGPAAPNYSDTGWRAVHLPHDFVVEGAFTPKGDVGHGSLLPGVGWYRKTFELPASDKGKRLWIDFDGVYRNSNVWLNGRLLGNHKSGYQGFRYEITEAANYGGRNTLAVRADSRAFEGWWYEGGGIYRHVWLNKANPLHVPPDSMFVTTKIKEDGSAEISAAFVIVNQIVDKPATSVKPSAPATLEVDVQTEDGATVKSAIVNAPAKAGDSSAMYVPFLLSEPKLWSPESPTLYRLVTKVRQYGKDVDTTTTTFGIRTIRFDAEKGFFLNGKPVKIKGTCNHQDFAGVGIAMPDTLLDWRIKKLKEMGSNAYRMSHNPPTAELLDACDRQGMLVMDETRHLGDTYQQKTAAGTPATDLFDLKDLILRDRNHPSVIMWSMCNEEGLQGSAEGARIFDAMKKATLQLDPTRPITCAMNGGWGQGITLVEDLQGCNYNPGGYDNFHKGFPTLPMYGSETASALSTRGEYVNDIVKGYVSAYDVNAPSWGQTAEVAWRAIAERPFVAGGYVWTGFDYKGEPTPYAWPCINSHFGIMDECGFPKDTYYYYQAWWGDRPVAHILPHWNWAGKEGQPIEVWVHSNAGKVELFLNGTSLGSKEMPRYGHLQWKVPYAPGKLEAKGYDANNKLIVTDVVETTGAPTQIRLSPNSSKLTANGEDVAMVEVAILDEKGRVVPFADNEVTFDVTGNGRIAGVGNGDPSSHEPDKALQRHAFHGLCLVVLQAGEKPGSLTISANGKGLKSSSVTVTVTK